MAELEREEEAVKWVEPSNIQIRPHRLNHRQTHSETAECAGDVFLKGNPGASERGGTIPLTHTLIPSSGDWALQLGQSQQHGFRGYQAASALSWRLPRGRDRVTLETTLPGVLRKSEKNRPTFK